MRADVIEGVAEVVEVALLGTEVGLGRASGFALESSVHADAREVWVLSRSDEAGAWGEPAQVTNFGCTGARWSPAGEQIVCASQEHIVVLNRDDREILRRIDPPASTIRVHSPQLMADGRVYFIALNSFGASEVWVAPLDGEPRVALANDDPALTMVNFVIKGDRMFFLLSEYESDIWAMDLVY